MSQIVQKLVKGLKSGKTVFATWSTLSDPLAVTLLMQEEFDTVVLDLQHGSMDYSSAVTTIGLLAGLGKPTIARVPVGDYALVSRLADAGAAAIIVPMINSVEDAQKLVAATKYPPIGERSWGPNTVERYTGLYGSEYFKAANEFTLCFAMFETSSALDNADEILNIDGLDGIFIGPADLSIGLTKGQTVDPLHPAVTETLKQLLEKTKKFGKYMAAFAPTPERAVEHIKQGFELVALTGDAKFLKDGAKQAINQVKSIL